MTDETNFPWLIQDRKLDDLQKKLLRGLSIDIAMPAYGGMLQISCAKAVSEFLRMADSLGIDARWSTLLNESLIQRARNTLARQFELNGATYLMFIDADIVFDPWQLLEMLLCAELNNVTLLGGDYPMKTINWAAVQRAVHAGATTSMLAHCSGANVIRGTVKGLHMFKPYVMEHMATGFMLIHKSVLASIREKKPDLWHHNNGYSLPMHEKVFQYFECAVKPIDGFRIYLSEDYYFSLLAAECGHKPHFAPWVQLFHIGTYHFSGCFFCSQNQYVHDITSVPPK